MAAVNVTMVAGAAVEAGVVVRRRWAWWRWRARQRWPGGSGRGLGVAGVVTAEAMTVVGMVASVVAVNVVVRSMALGVGSGRAYGEGFAGCRWLPMAIVAGMVVGMSAKWCF